MDRAGIRTPPPLGPWRGLVPLVVTAAIIVATGKLMLSWILLAVGLFHILLLEFIAGWTARRGGRGTPMEAITNAGVHLTRLVEVALALSMSLLTLAVAFGLPLRPGWFLTTILGLLTVAVVLGLRRM